MFDEDHRIENFVATGKDITQRIKMEQKLQRYATTDELTNLSNRRRGNELLDIELDRFHRYQSSFAILMIDIDHFKNINDTYGHDIGDQVLQQLGKVLTLHIRKSDALMRWGGEEFLIIAVHMSQNELISFANKLIAAVNSYTFDKASDLTISIGATLCQENETKANLLKRVDKALYKAKKSGRNRVVYL